MLNSRVKNIFGNLLNVVNVIKFKCTLNFLLPQTLAAVNKFRSGNKRKDSEANSTRETVF